MYLKENFKEVIIAIITFFRQSAKMLSQKYKTFLGGNVDPFYIFGGLYIIKNIKNKEKMKKYLIYIMPILIYALLQIIILAFIGEISIFKVFVNITKICICIAAMLYTIENYKKINILKIIETFTYINLFFMVMATTIGRQSFLWRLNDVFNEYSKTRLQMFFLEPSELGFHVAIILLFSLVFLFISKNIQNKKKIILYILVNGLCLILAKPMGAICALAAAIFIMITYAMLRKPTKKKIYLYVFIILVIIIISIILVQYQNPIAMRIIDTINGNDPSNNYRVGVSYKTFAKTLKDYYLIGCGFGNINTEAFITRYSLATVIVNSFVYLWIEAGIFGVVYSLVLIGTLFIACKRSKSVLKWGLFTFLIIYQFAGSHFVNPLSWMIYGLIFSDFHEKSAIKEKENA